MKRNLIAILVILAAVAVFVVPLLTGKTVIEDPAQFSFEKNLQIAFDETVDIGITLKQDDLESIMVTYGDTVLQNWKNPKGDLSFKLSGSIRGIGAKKIELVAKLSDGSARKDTRMVRVVSDIKPEELEAQIITTYPHADTSFTQGLEFYEGRLFESTGQFGRSSVFEVDLTTGSINKEVSYGLDASRFGEGITILNGTIYQLTWQRGVCLTYSLEEKIIPKGDFSYTGEGWGLCNDGESLIMSNGTERIVFRNPETFMVERTIEVYNNYGPVVALNELEYIDGLIYANVWQTDRVVVIDPVSGKVLKQIDGSKLLEKGQGFDKEVMNGIAYNKETGKIYMTGKNWVSLFEVQFVKKAS